VYIVGRYDGLSVKDTETCLENRKETGLLINAKVNNNWPADNC
jgi:hypothetical protein